MLTKKKKDAVIKKYRTHASDTGSPEVQIAVLSEEIEELSEHLKSHKHDFSSRRGLLRKVSLRRRLLRYLQRESDERYDVLVKRLKLKKLPIQKKDEVIEELEEATARAEAKGEEEKPAAE